MRRLVVALGVALALLWAAGVQAPRLPALPRQWADGGAHLRQAGRLLEALPDLRDCLDAVGREGDPRALQAVCDRFRRASG